MSCQVVVAKWVIIKKISVSHQNPKVNEKIEWKRISYFIANLICFELSRHSWIWRLLIEINSELHWPRQYHISSKKEIAIEHFWSAVDWAHLCNLTARNVANSKDENVRDGLCFRCDQRRQDLGKITAACILSIQSSDHINNVWITTHHSITHASILLRKSLNFIYYTSPFTDFYWYPFRLEQAVMMASPQRKLMCQPSLTVRVHQNLALRDSRRRILAWVARWCVIFWTFFLSTLWIYSITFFSIYHT